MRDARIVQQSKLNVAYTEFYEKLAPKLSRPTRFEFHDTVIEKIGAQTPLYYLEFGVARGASIKRFSEHFTNPESRFYGFDSFIGLPEKWAQMDAGHFSTQGAPPKIADSRVSFVPGWFQNSLPAFFEKTPASAAANKTVLVHYDADLYSSTWFLLSSLWWKFRDYYFIMDEFYGDELIALHEFTRCYPVEIEFYSQMPGTFRERLGYTPPHKIFGRLKNIEMVVKQEEKAS